MANKWKIRKGDDVVVISGADRGRKGRVLRVFPDRARAIVQGAMMVKRHQRQTPQSQGGIVEKESSIHLSNLAIADPRSGAPSRIGFKRLEDGRKVRFAKASGEVLDKA